MAGEALILDPGAAARSVTLAPLPPPADPPLVSCIMATRGALHPARHAIACFDRQTYPHRELVVTCAAPGSAVERHIAGRADPRIRFVAADGARTAGALRNAAIAQAAGDYVCVWDDDDLSHPERLEWQMAALAAAGARGCLLSRVILWWPARRQMAVSARRSWENSLLVARDALVPYPDLPRGSDTHVVAALRAACRLVAIDRPAAYLYVAHDRNLWGAEHFAMLFRNASEPDADYDRAVAGLSQAMPLADYAAGLSDPAAGG